MPIDRSRLRRRTLLAAGAAAAALAGGLLTAGTAVAAPAVTPTPLATASGPLLGGDPGVLHVTSGADVGWYVYSTGGNDIKVAKAATLTGTYTAPAAALTPQAWFPPANLAPDGSHDLWAPSVFDIDGHYVMYFAAWDSAHQQRCVGVAEAAHPLDQFTVVPGTNPICAPKAADYGSKLAEAIDPSFYKDPSSGQRYLLFKAGTADQHNVAIWSYKMQANGEDREPGTPSVVLRSKGPGLVNAIENPDLIDYGGTLYLFVSANYYDGCAYHTDVYSAASITTFTNSQTPTHLLTKSNTTLCGPGGASVTIDGTTIIYHAWQNGTPSSGARVDYTSPLAWNASGPYVS